MKKSHSTPDEDETIARLARTLEEDPRNRESLSVAGEQIAAGRGSLLF
jgi:hypothetical protein